MGLEILTHKTVPLLAQQQEPNIYENPRFLAFKKARNDSWPGFDIKCALKQMHCLMSFRTKWEILTSEATQSLIVYELLSDFFIQLSRSSPH